MHDSPLFSHIRIDVTFYHLTYSTFSCDFFCYCLYSYFKSIHHPPFFWECYLLMLVPWFGLMVLCAELLLGKMHHKYILIPIPIVIYTLHAYWCSPACRHTVCSNFVFQDHSRFNWNSLQRKTTEPRGAKLIVIQWQSIIAIFGSSQRRYTRKPV